MASPSDLDLMFLDHYNYASVINPKHTLNQTLEQFKISIPNQEIFLKHLQAINESQLRKSFVPRLGYATLLDFGIRLLNLKCDYTVVLELLNRLMALFFSSAIQTRYATSFVNDFKWAISIPRSILPLDSSEAMAYEFSAIHSALIAYPLDNIYYFNELNMTTGNGIFTFSLCGNLSLSNILDPLIVTNLPNSKFNYCPTGLLNSHHLNTYLKRLDFLLRTQNKKIVLICRNNVICDPSNFTNIHIQYVSIMFDRYFVGNSENSRLLDFPTDYGVLTWIKLCLAERFHKLHLFKEPLLILNELILTYHDCITRLLTDPQGKNFYRQDVKTSAFLGKFDALEVTPDPNMVSYGHGLRYILRNESFTNIPREYFKTCLKEVNYNISSKDVFFTLTQIQKFASSSDKIENDSVKFVEALDNVVYPFLASKNLIRKFLPLENKLLDMMNFSNTPSSNPLVCSKFTVPSAQKVEFTNAFQIEEVLRDSKLPVNHDNLLNNLFEFDCEILDEVPEAERRAEIVPETSSSTTDISGARISVSEGTQTEFLDRVKLNEHAVNKKRALVSVGMQTSPRKMVSAILKCTSIGTQKDLAAAVNLPSDNSDQSDSNVSSIGSNVTNQVERQHNLPTRAKVLSVSKLTPMSTNIPNQHFISKFSNILQTVTPRGNILPILPKIKKITIIEDMKREHLLFIRSDIASIFSDDSEISDNSFDPTTNNKIKMLGSQSFKSPSRIREVIFTPEELESENELQNETEVKANAPHLYSGNNSHQAESKDLETETPNEISNIDVTAEDNEDTDLEMKPRRRRRRRRTGVELFLQDEARSEGDEESESNEESNLEDDLHEAVAAPGLYSENNEEGEDIIYSDSDSARQSVDSESDDSIVHDGSDLGIEEDDSLLDDSEDSEEIVAHKTHKSIVESSSNESNYEDAVDQQIEDPNKDQEIENSVETTTSIAASVSEGPLQISESAHAIGSPDAMDAILPVVAIGLANMTQTELASSTPHLNETDMRAVMSRSTKKPELDQYSNVIFVPRSVPKESRYNRRFQSDDKFGSLSPRSSDASRRNSPAPESSSDSTSMPSRRTKNRVYTSASDSGDKSDSVSKPSSPETVGPFELSELVHSIPSVSGTTLDAETATNTSGNHIFSLSSHAVFDTKIPDSKIEKETGEVAFDSFSDSRTIDSEEDSNSDNSGSGSNLETTLTSGPHSNIISTEVPNEIGSIQAKSTESEAMKSDSESSDDELSSEQESTPEIEIISERAKVTLNTEEIFLSSTRIPGVKGHKHILNQEDDSLKKGTQVMTSTVKEHDDPRRHNAMFKSSSSYPTSSITIKPSKMVESSDSSSSDSDSDSSSGSSSDSSSSSSSSSSASESSSSSSSSSESSDSVLETTANINLQEVSELASSASSIEKTTNNDLASKLKVAGASAKKVTTLVASKVDGIKPEVRLIIPSTKRQTTQALFPRKRKKPVQVSPIKSLNTLSDLKQIPTTKDRNRRIGGGVGPSPSKVTFKGRHEFGSSDFASSSDSDTGMFEESAPQKYSKEKQSLKSYLSV